MTSPRHAIFFVYVWPEPLSSAAGVRTRELMRALTEEGWKVTAVSPSGPSRYSEELNALGIDTVSCDPNDSAETDKKLFALSPSLVIYDRFVMEEQFGWRARNLWSQAFQLVDTQDLHSLRRARERLVKAGARWESVLQPREEEMGEDLLRELASLHRVDGALVVSSFEFDLLTQKLGFPHERLLCLPFSAEADEAVPPFSERSGFCFLGNFRHPPNLDSVRWLLTELWPVVRQQLPEAELHLYGAYPPAEISQHKGANGVFSHGPVTDHRSALRRHKALLAPLRFGAGIKGKVLEAWGTGTPVVGSLLTFEGMGYEGLVTTDAREFAHACAALEGSESLWSGQSEAGVQAVRNRFARESVKNTFLAFLRKGLQGLENSRSQNLLGRILRHQQSNSTKYFSRWIEAKNAGQPDA